MFLVTADEPHRCRDVFGRRIRAPRVSEIEHIAKAIPNRAMYHHAMLERVQPDRHRARHLQCGAAKRNNARAIPDAGIERGARILPVARGSR